MNPLAMPAMSHNPSFISEILSLWCSPGKNEIISGFNQNLKHSRKPSALPNNGLKSIAPPKKH
jgi:hypothetical protein